MLHIIKFQPIDNEPVPRLMSIDKLEQLEKQTAEEIHMGVMYDKCFTLDEVKTILKAVGADIVVSFDKPIEGSKDLWETEIPGITEFIQPANFFGLLLPENMTDDELEQTVDLEEYRDFSEPDVEFFDELGKDLCLKLLDYWDFSLPGYTEFSDYVEEDM